MEQSLAFKAAAARAAIDHVVDAVPSGAILGVGTGTTSAAFIAQLPRIADRIDGFVASSEATRRALEALGLRVLDLNDAGELPMYVDGADQVTPVLDLLKGGGGALTREKIVAAASRELVCIADESKLVAALHGDVPVEVIPMARTAVTRTLEALGMSAKLRAGFVTDNGNVILDARVRSLSANAERDLELITGVVACGLFVRRPADRAFIAGPGGVRQITR